MPRPNSAPEQNPRKPARADVGDQPKQSTWGDRPHAIKGAEGSTGSSVAGGPDV